MNDTTNTEEKIVIDYHNYETQDDPNDIVDTMMHCLSGLIDS